MADQPDSTNPTDVKPPTADARHRSKKANVDRPRQSANPAREEKQEEVKKPDGFNMLRKKARIAHWVKLRTDHPELTKKEIGEKLGISIHTLERDLRYAQQEGLINFDEPLEKLKYEIIPGVMSNIAEFVRNKDRTVTLETAKATVFKQYAAELGIVDGGQHILALKIEMSGPEGETKVVEGQIVGRAKELEGN